MAEGTFAKFDYDVLPSQLPCSVGGLLAARVCHDHFDDVVIVEPEMWLNSEDARRTDSWNQGNRRSRVMQYESFQGVSNCSPTTSLDVIETPL